MGNTSFGDNKHSHKHNTGYNLHNPYKEGWLWKQSRHLKKWRKRWIVIQSHFIYTFPDKRMYDNPTEIIDLRNFTYLTKESAFQEPIYTTQQKFANFKRKFAFTTSHKQQFTEEQKQKLHLIILSDLNNDDSFVFKCPSRQSQCHWIYSLERALKYKSNLIQNIVASDIIKYVVSLYFLSFERLKLCRISLYFEQLFSFNNYNCKYHYYHDGIYWHNHFRKFCKIKQNESVGIDGNKRKSLLFDYNFNEHKYDESLDELQFNDTSFYLSSKDWFKCTRHQKLQLKYFFIFYHEFAALNYKKEQTELSTHYIPFRSQQHGNKDNERLDECVSDDIIEELNILDLKYENIRLDGYEWDTFYDKWIDCYGKASFVSCNIQTLCIGSSTYYDESCSMMTQLANNAIDANMKKIIHKKGYLDHKYSESRFWRHGGIQWFCDVIKYSYAFTSHLSTIRIISLRDSNFTDTDLKLFCNAINSRKYESSKPLTLKKLILSNNPNVTDNMMKLLFTTIGNKLQYLEELELNDLGITDEIGYIIIDFYVSFHQNHNVVQLYSISLLGNLFSLNGFKIMNTLFENDIIDEMRFINGERKRFHIGVNARKVDAKNFGFDSRLHIVVSNMNPKATFRP